MPSRESRDTNKALVGIIPPGQNPQAPQAPQTEHGIASIILGENILSPLSEFFIII
jgi:hypothetical protein